MEKDEIYQAYKNGKLTNASDFDKFCIQHCKDIEELLEENEELKKRLEKDKNKYIQKVEKLLANDIEPDPEDFYLAEIEGKSNDYDKLLNCQKEFKKWLEDEINSIFCSKSLKLSGFDIEPIVAVYNNILQKCKEIIGSDLNVGSKVANVVKEEGMQYLVLDRDEVFYDDCLEPSSDKDIKSKVTKEQFERISYKI